MTLALGEQMPDYVSGRRAGGYRKYSTNVSWRASRRAAAGAGVVGQHCLSVTAVGSVAEQNLRELGHIACASMVCVSWNFPTPYVAGLYAGR